MRLEVLAERIRQKKIDTTGTQVFVRSDGGLLVQDLIDVLGELKAAGVQAAGIVTKLPGE
jgi:biopolymer transport protein ExbD